MYKIIRPLLFLFDPESVHHFTFRLIKILSAFRLLRLFNNKSLSRHLQLQRNVFGITFPNPVGLAAGLDKNALLISEFADLGFGFIEIGTVTPKAQPGNPKPRLFRLKKDQAIINRMGFNNDGVDKVVERLKKRNKNIIVGGNIGKNKDTPNENALSDYEICFDKLHPWVDYFVVNVSSPNTPGLRELQEKEPLKKILSHLKSKNISKSVAKPILLKIAPDLTLSQLDDIIDIVNETQIDGVIATNTTVSRDNLKESEEVLEKIGQGGLSGKPLKEKSTEVIRYLSKKSNNAFPIIAVGGIHSPKDAIEKLNAGASLVQIYTGFIYEGPDLIKQINRNILVSVTNKVKQ